MHSNTVSNFVQSTQYYVAGPSVLFRLSAARSDRPPLLICNRSRGPSTQPSFVVAAVRFSTAAHVCSLVVARILKTRCLRIASAVLCLVNDDSTVFPCRRSSTRQW